MQAFECIPWQTGFSTGIAFLDQRHQTFFGLLNQLLTLQYASPDFESLDTVIAAIKRYDSDHIQEEQAWIQNFGDETTGFQQQLQHQNFHVGLQSVLNQRQNNDKTCQLLIQFLLNWLVTHVFDNDYPMAQALRQPLANSAWPCQPQQTQDLSQSKPLTMLISDLVRRLLHSHRMATDADQSKIDITRLLAGVNHDLRTPLSAINSMIYLLRREGLSTSHAELITNIELSCQNLLSLINDVIDLSKIQTGKLELNIHTVDINAIIRHVCFTLSNKATEKNIILQTDLEYQTLLLQGDAARLQQCFSGLVNIAIKLTDNCSIHLGKSIMKQTAQSTQLQFEILHRGNAVHAAALLRLFEPTVLGTGKLNKYTTNDLNLALSKALAQMQEGSIAIHSLPDHETRIVFTVTLANNPT